MDKNMNPMVQFQILVAVWALIGVAIGFVMTCALFLILETRERKRPGINLRDL